MSRSLEELSQVEKQSLVDVIAKKKNGLLDKDWVEICSDFDLGINYETLRKAGVGIKLAIDANMLNGSAEDMSDGYIERQKLRDLTCKVNSMYKTESRSELLREAVKEAVNNLPSPLVRDGICMERLPQSSGKKALVLTIGDMHYGAEIHVTGLHGDVLNHYDHNVFEMRMKELLNEVVDILKKEEISETYVFLVGDLLDGMLRQSQLMRLEYGLVDSTIKLSEFLALWIAELSCYTLVNVSAVTGNHSEVRPLKSKNREFEEENLERIVMWYLESRLEDIDRVFIDSECSRMKMVDVLGYHCLLLHGDGNSNISQIAKETVNLYGYPIDFFFCGHKHKENEYPSGTTDSGNSVIVRTPSICGMDKYAQSKGFGGKPGSVAMVLEEGYGRRCVYPITLQAV